MCPTTTRCLCGVFHIIPKILLHVNPYLYYKERRQLKTFLTTIWLHLTPHAGPTRKVVWWQKSGTTIKIVIWEAFLPKTNYFSHPRPPYPPGVPTSGPTCVSPPPPSSSSNPTVTSQNTSLRLSGSSGPSQPKYESSSSSPSFFGTAVVFLHPTAWPSADSLHERAVTPRRYEAFPHQRWLNVTQIPVQGGWQHIYYNRWISLSHYGGIVGTGVPTP
jgi:hypothetical protein